MDVRISMLDLLLEIIVKSHLPKSSKGEDSSFNIRMVIYTGCEHTTVQLMGGQNKFESRVEVCQNGQWKTVCNSDWDDKEAQVVYRQLGFAEDARSAAIT